MKENTFWYDNILTMFFRQRFFIGIIEKLFTRNPFLRARATCLYGRYSYPYCVKCSRFSIFARDTGGFHMSPRDLFNSPARELGLRHPNRIRGFALYPLCCLALDGALLSGAYNCIGPCRGWRHGCL